MIYKFNVCFDFITECTTNEYTSNKIKHDQNSNTLYSSIKCVTNV